MKYKCLSLTLIVLFNFWVPCFAQKPIVLEHAGAVSSVAFSPVNPALVASAGGHNTVKLWNLRNNTVKTLTGHTDVVNSVTFSPDGKWLVSGSSDATIKMWDVSQSQNVETREPITFRMPSSVPQVAFHPNGQLLATSGRHVQLLDIINQTEVATLPHDSWVWVMDFSHDGKYLAADDGVGTTMKVWDVEKHQITATLDGHAGDVNFVKFSPDTRTLATASWGGDIKLWSVSNWEPLGTLRSGAAALDFSPDGKILASAGWEAVTLWSVENGERIATLRGHTGGRWIRGLAFSPDGGTLASGGGDGTVHIWDIEPHLRSPSEIVRLIYFLPKDRAPQPDIDAKLDRLIKDAQQAFAEIMERHGFGRKTFRFETDVHGKAVVHHIVGRFTDEHYRNLPYTWDIWEEIDEQFDTSTNIYLTVIDISSEILDGGEVCGRGGHRGSAAGRALMPASGDCFNVDVIAHELGHAFGVQHDYRPNPKLILSAHTADRMIRSFCAAEWLDAHRYFNTHKTGFNEVTTIEMRPPQAVPPNDVRLRFEITDPDGLHQAQLLTPEEESEGLYAQLMACKDLDGISSTVEFVVPKTIFRQRNEVTLWVIDRHGNFAAESFNGDLRAGPKIEGPWVWTIVPTGTSGSAAATSGIDYLAEASDGVVTEKQVAANGATTGEAVGNSVWTLGRIAPTGGNNITEMVNAIGLGEGDVDNYVAYGSIALDSPRLQETRMHVGSDDAIKVWLNGVLVHDNPVDRGAKDYQENFPVTLKQGTNILLVAVYEGAVYWSGFFGFDKAAEYAIRHLSPIARLEAFERPPLYWINAQRGSLHRLIDAKVENLVPNVRNAKSLAVDVAGGKVYWTEQTSDKTGKIRRANLDGSNVELVKNLTSVPHGLALDATNGNLYLTNAWGKIQRMNLNGTNFQPNLIPDLASPTDIAVDGIVGKVYWTEQTSDKTGKIRRANLDGSNVELVKNLTSVPHGLALDATNGKLYLTNAWGKVQRMDLNGTNFQPNLITGLDAPRSIVVDGIVGKVYWTEQDSIRRTDLDNVGNIQDVAIGLGVPIGVALGTPTLSEGEDPSQILYFSFEELNGNRVIDHSQYQNHGTLVGNPQLVDGKFGKALQFNGESDWVEVPHDDSLTVDENVTVMAWIWTPRHHGPGGALWQGIVGKSNNPRSYSFYTEADGELHLSVGGSGSSSDEKVALNEWQHVVAQVDDGWHRYWINGKNVGNFQINGAPLGRADMASVRIGNTHESGRHFLGLIDEVRIYNRALSETEVIEQMEKGNPIIPTGTTVSQQVKEDVNDDGAVDVQDLQLVEANLEATGENAADVNDDGIVDTVDRTLVLGAIGSAAAAPSVHTSVLAHLTAAEVEQWFWAARRVKLVDATFQRGIQILKAFLLVLIPQETALLANYPNPFNPETWIPYHLSTDAAVIVTIYDIRGVAVRELVLGYQSAGVYQSRSRAAYWDGRNALGEPVASGVYFYTLTAGDFTATRKMLIQK